jgi:hypothetical protein
MGYSLAYDGYEVSGTTAGDNSYGLKQSITLTNGTVYVIDFAVTQIDGTSSGIDTLKVDGDVETDGVPFTFTGITGSVEVKAFGADTGGTAFEHYVDAFTLSEVTFQEGYRAVFADRVSQPRRGRKVIYLAAAPSTGVWAVGEVVYNTAPAAGGTIGWVCTTAGGPGTWKTFGTIAS